MKNQNAPRPSEHPPVRGGGNVKTFRWDQRLQMQNLFMAFKWISLMVVTLGQHSIMSERSPPLYCTLILITMHSHQS